MVPLRGEGPQRRGAVEERAHATGVAEQRAHMRVCRGHLEDIIPPKSVSTLSVLQLLSMLQFY